jgi:translation initiation factor 3 subunit G
VYLPPPQVIEDEKAGTKTVISYRLEPNGQKVKVTSKFKIATKTKKVSARVAERASWGKFGKSLTTNDAQTIVSRDEIRIEDPKDGDGTDTREHDAILLQITSGLQQGSQGRELQIRMGLDPDAARKGGLYNPLVAQGGSAGGGPGDKYVPPSMRGGGGGQREERDESNTLRVTNISEDAQERDLKDLFEKFGPVMRIYLAKDKETGQSRGFAYVTYQRREDAQAAMNALNGYGYDHLILKVEWSEKAPASRDDVGSQHVTGKYMSGYGKALPQG